MLSNFFSKITATISFHDLVLSGLAVGITYCPAMVTSIESKMTEPASYAKLRPHKSIQFPFRRSFDFKQAKKTLVLDSNEGERFVDYILSLLFLAKKDDKSTHYLQ